MMDGGVMDDGVMDGWPGVGICDCSRGYNGTQSACADTSVQPRPRSAKVVAVRADAAGAASRGLRGFP